MNRRLRLSAWLVFLVAANSLAAAPVYRPKLIDKHALKAPAAAEESVEALAKYLVKPARSDREKVRAIYRWVTDRIRYDAEGLLTRKPGDNSTKGALASRCVVCEGYANLVRDLCGAAGLEVVKVIGRTKPEGTAPVEKETLTLHAWNAVKFEKKWWLLDATWGAGSLDHDKKFVKRFKDYYFLTPPEQLIYTHLPNETKWQLLPTPVAEEEFDSTPRVSPQLFAMGLTPAKLRKKIQDKKFHELVKIYDYPGRPVRIRLAPLDRQLKAGSRQRFRVEAADYEVLAVRHDGKFYPLSQRGRVFEGVVVVPRGKFMLMGRPRKARTNTYHGILEYEGK